MCVASSNCIFKLILNKANTNGTKHVHHLEGVNYCKSHKSTKSLPRNK